MAHDSMDPKAIEAAACGGSDVAAQPIDAEDAQQEIDKLKAAMMDKLGCLKSANESRINTAEAIARKARETRSNPHMAAVRPKPLEEKASDLTSKFAALRAVGK